MNISSNSVLKQENSTPGFNTAFSSGKPSNNLKSLFYYQNIPSDIDALSDISSTDKRLLNYFLMELFNRKDIRLDRVRGRWDSNATLAAKTGLSLRAIQYSKKRLEKAGYIRLFLRFWNGKRASDFLCLTHKTIQFFKDSIKPDFAKVKRVPCTPKIVSPAPNLSNSFYLSSKKYIDTTELDTSVCSEDRPSSDGDIFDNSLGPFGQASGELTDPTNIAHEPEKDEIIPDCQIPSENEPQSKSEDRIPKKIVGLFLRLKKLCPGIYGDAEDLQSLMEYHGWSSGKVLSRIIQIEKYQAIRIQVFSVRAIFFMQNRESKIYQRAGLYPPATKTIPSNLKNRNSDPNTPVYLPNCGPDTTAYGSGWSG